METTIVYWGDIGIMEKKMENYYSRDHAVDPVAQNQREKLHILG